MNEKLLALKKKISDNKTVVVAATTGVVSAGIAAYAVHKHYDNKLLFEVTRDGMRRLHAGYVGIFNIEGVDLILMRDPNQIH